MKPYSLLLAFFACFLVFPFYFLHASGPETFDHMTIFKSKHPPVHHPSKEEMLIDNKLKASALYFYNTQNQLVKTEYLNAGAKDGYTIYNYNVNGLQSELLYNNAGNLVEKLVYILDKQGNILRYDIYNGKGELKLTWIFDYNKGKLIEGRRVADKKVSESFSVEYGKDGNKVQNVFSDNEKMGEILYLYQGNKLKQRRQSFPNTNRQVDYFYNSQGQLTEMRFSSSEKNTANFKQVKTHVLKYSF